MIENVLLQVGLEAPIELLLHAGHVHLHSYTPEDESISQGYVFWHWKADYSYLELPDHSILLLKLML